MRDGGITVEPLAVNRHFQVSQWRPGVDLLRGPHTAARLARTRSSDPHRLPPPGTTDAFATAFAFLGTRPLVRGDDRTVIRNLAYGRAGKRLLQGRGAVVWDARPP